MCPTGKRNWLVMIPAAVFVRLLYSHVMSRMLYSGSWWLTSDHFIFTVPAWLTKMPKTHGPCQNQQVFMVLRHVSICLWLGFSSSCMQMFINVTEVRDMCLWRRKQAVVNDIRKECENCVQFIFSCLQMNFMKLVYPRKEHMVNQNGWITWSQNIGLVVREFALLTCRHSPNMSLEWVHNETIVNKELCRDKKLAHREVYMQINMANFCWTQSNCYISLSQQL